MKVITSCMNCLGRSSCPVWRQLTTDQRIAYYGEGIIRPDCPLDEMPRNISLIEMNEAGMAGFQQGVKFSDDRWQEKIETIIEKLKMLSNQYEYIDKQYVIRKTTLDVFIQELEDEK